MFKSFLACVTFVVLAFAHPAPAFAGKQDFQLVNETGETIMKAFVSLSAIPDWEDDVLGTSVLADGNRFKVTFSRNYPGCFFDVKVELRSGRTLRKWRQDLCSLNEVRFQGRDETVSGNSWRYY